MRITLRGLCLLNLTLQIELVNKQTIENLNLILEDRVQEKTTGTKGKRTKIGKFVKQRKRTNDSFEN